MSERNFVPAIPPEEVYLGPARLLEMRECVDVFDPPEYSPRTHYLRSVPGQMSLEEISHA